MSEQKVFNRWLLVVGALMIQLCLGAIYAWSVFRQPLQEELGISATQASLPFSVVLAFFALAVAIGGKLQDRFGPRVISVAGGILLAAGMLGASFAGSITTLVISYGVISGLGIGMAYVCPIAALVKWFPDKRGLITGLAVAGFGGGAMIVGPLAQAMIGSLGVADTFRILGLVYLIVVTAGGLMLRNPPAGYVPEGWTPPAPATGGPSGGDYSVGGMLGTGQFWIIWILYFAGCAAGLMIIGQTSPIGTDVAKYSAEVAALGVSVLAIFNAAGRIFWGKVSDNLGRVRTLFIMYLLNGLAILGYFLIPTVPAFYWLGIAIVGATFGGYLALYPAITADFFGTTNVGLKYGLVFLAYGIGGLLSNIFAPQVFEIFGSYNPAFAIAGGLCIIAAVAILFVKPPPAPKEA